MDTIRILTVYKKALIWLQEINIIYIINNARERHAASTEIPGGVAKKHILLEISILPYVNPITKY